MRKPHKIVSALMVTCRPTRGTLAPVSSARSRVLALKAQATFSLTEESARLRSHLQCRHQTPAVRDAMRLAAWRSVFESSQAKAAAELAALEFK
eukprot:1799781-Pleurochrysis_carterae.AAC.1